MNSNRKYIALGLLMGGASAIAGILFAKFLALQVQPAVVPDIPAATYTAFIVPAAFTPTWTPTTSPSPTDSPTPVQPATATPDRLAALSGGIDKIAAESSGDWNIIIRENGERTLYSYNPDQTIHIASIFKVPIAMLFFKSLEKKGMQPTEYADYLSTHGIGRTYMQLLKAMLVESEEAATGTLREFIAESKLDETAALQSWGTVQTDVSDIESRHSTPADIAAIYESLYYGRNIPPEARVIILDLLSAYTPNDDTRLGILRPLLPADGKFYNKRGTVTAGRLIVGDAALLSWSQNGKEKVYVLVVLGYGSIDTTTDVKLSGEIEDIARLFWEYAYAE